MLLVGCVFSPDVPTFDAAPCVEVETHVSCLFSTVAFRRGASVRDVHLQLPVGGAPDVGWPTVLFFQGSLYTAQNIWEGDSSDPLGGLHQTRLVARLLDQGFAVLAPETKWQGYTWWDTNVWPSSFWWEGSDDNALMISIFEAIDAGDLGPLDPDHLYATGISSGGYMASRMAVSYPGRVRALAIQSASYATCAGFVCVVGAIPDDHPPTLFLHGEADPVVPIATMESYSEALGDAGIEVAEEREPGTGHAWIAAAPDVIPAWFVEHR